MNSTSLMAMQVRFWLYWRFAILWPNTALEAASWHGSRLMAKAKYSARGCSWESPNHAYRNDLTGLAHGAAGAGLALVELYRATGDSKALQVALDSFAYEDSWFNIENGNWPDFREDAWHRRRQRQARDFACFWCHGAPGILLTRLRALRITGDSKMADRVRQALETTRAMLSNAVQSGDGSFSLCHGLAGNADVIMLSAEYLGEQVVSADGYPSVVGAAGIERAQHDRLIGPGSGVDAPGLMHGMAGVGYFYLPLGGRRIPSVLLPAIMLWHSLSPPNYGTFPLS